MIEQILNIINAALIFKVIYLLLSGLLFGFFIVVLKQTFAMRAVIDDKPASELLNGIALFNVFVGFTIFVAALVIL